MIKKWKKIFTTLGSSAITAGIITGSTVSITNCSFWLTSNTINILEWQFQNKEGSYRENWSIDAYTQSVSKNFRPWLVNNIANLLNLAFASEPSLKTAQFQYDFPVGAIRLVENPKNGNKEINLDDFSFTFLSDFSIDTGKGIQSTQAEIGIKFQQGQLQFNQDDGSESFGLTMSKLNFEDELINVFILNQVNFNFKNLEISFDNGNFARTEKYADPVEYILAYKKDETVFNRILSVDNQRIFIYFDFLIDSYLGNYFYKSYINAK